MIRTTLTTLALGLLASAAHGSTAVTTDSLCDAVAHTVTVNTQGSKSFDAAACKGDASAAALTAGSVKAVCDNAANYFSGSLDNYALGELCYGQAFSLVPNFRQATSADAAKLCSSIIDTQADVENVSARGICQYHADEAVKAKKTVGAMVIDSCTNFGSVVHGSDDGLECIAQAYAVLSL